MKAANELTGDLLALESIVYVGKQGGINKSILIQREGSLILLLV